MTAHQSAGHVAWARSEFGGYVEVYNFGGILWRAKADKPIDPDTGVRLTADLLGPATSAAGILGMLKIVPSPESDIAERRAKGVAR